jgi:hypothetical protein
MTVVFSFQGEHWQSASGVNANSAAPLHDYFSRSMEP